MFGIICFHCVLYVFLVRMGKFDSRCSPLIMLLVPLIFAGFAVAVGQAIERMPVSLFSQWYKNVLDLPKLDTKNWLAVGRRPYEDIDWTGFLR